MTQVVYVLREFGLLTPMVTLVGGLVVIALVIYFLKRM